MMDIDMIVSQVTARVMEKLSPEEKAALAAETSYLEIPGKLEHSLLNPDMTIEKMRQGCKDARNYGMGVVCATPYLVPVAKEALAGSNVKVCSIAGFPHAAASTEAKLAEIRYLTEAGADEIDIALNIVAIKSGRLDDARADLEAMINAVRGRAAVKAIYEQGLYTLEEKERVLAMIKRSGAEFVKISNNLPGGHKAIPEDVKFVRDRVGRGVKIKIDGGVKTLDTALGLFNAGADRVGLTATVAVCEEAMKKAK